MIMIMSMPVTLVIAVVMIMRVSRSMQIKARKSRRDHGCIKMATFTCVDLYCGGTRRAYPVGIVGGLLITLDHGQRGDGRPFIQRVDRRAQQGGFSGSGA